MELYKGLLRLLPMRLWELLLFGSMGVKQEDMKSLMILITDGETSVSKSRRVYLAQIYFMFRGIILSGILFILYKYVLANVIAAFALRMTASANSKNLYILSYVGTLTCVLIIVTTIFFMYQFYTFKLRLIGCEWDNRQLLIKRSGEVCGVFLVGSLCSFIHLYTKSNAYVYILSSLLIVYCIIATLVKLVLMELNIILKFSITYVQGEERKVNIKTDVRISLKDGTERIVDLSKESLVICDNNDILVYKEKDILDAIRYVVTKIDCIKIKNDILKYVEDKNEWTHMQ